MVGGGGVSSDTGPTAVAGMPGDTHRMLLSGCPCIITPLWEMAFPRVWNLRLREVQGLPEVTQDRHPGHLSPGATAGPPVPLAGPQG